jgi:uncharacterized protein (DUF1697 family)
MRWVAFMRNVNQGQRGHPSTADIRAGFADAGCPDIRTFQSNGTIVFDSDAPEATVADAAEAIAARSGQERDILWVPMADLVAIVGEHGSTREPARCEVTLHHGGRIDADDAEVHDLARKYRCVIIDVGEGWALVRNDIDGQGHATRVLELVTGEPASSRGLPTIQRLVARFAAR